MLEDGSRLSPFPEVLVRRHGRFIAGRKARCGRVSGAQREGLNPVRAMLDSLRPILAVLTGPASGPCDPFGESCPGEVEVLVPGQGCVHVGDGGVGTFPGEL